jgi:hypothetical protein
MLLLADRKNGAAMAKTAIGQIEAVLRPCAPPGMGHLPFSPIGRRNGASATILKPELLAKLCDRLREPPLDGGLWSNRKVADWMGGKLVPKPVAP